MVPSTSFLLADWFARRVSDLLLAMERVEGVHLHVVGAALESDRDGIEHEIRDTLQSRSLHAKVTLHGMLTRSEILRLLPVHRCTCLTELQRGSSAKRYRGPRGRAPSDCDVDPGLS